MKHVLVTGGSDGLGKVSAKKLKEAGFKVTILSRDEQRTKAVAEEIGCEYVVADVSDHEMVGKALARATKVSGQVDVLINNAGIWIQGPIEDDDPKKIKRTLEVNTLGPIYCTQAVIPNMKKRRSGRIINVISQGGLYAKSERGSYGTSKWGLTGFTRSMQAELKPFNISVVGLFPSALKSPMKHSIFSKAGNARDMSKGLDPAVVADAIVYICKLPDGINVTEFGIESLEY